MMLRHASSFKDLVVYEKARATAKEIFEITKSFPKDEIYSLTSQVRRSSRSIGAQIAEAWGKRRYERHFVADAEQMETQHWLETSADCEYITSDQVMGLTSGLEEIGRMLNSMIEKAPSFCSSTKYEVRESAEQYALEPNPTDH